MYFNKTILYEHLEFDEPIETEDGFYIKSMFSGSVTFLNKDGQFMDSAHIDELYEELQTQIVNIVNNKKYRIIHDPDYESDLDDLGEL